MRRLARWTLNALTVLSLVICFATAGLWQRSYRQNDWCLWGRYGASSWQGRIVIAAHPSPTKPRPFRVKTHREFNGLPYYWESLLTDGRGLHHFAGIWLATLPGYAMFVIGLSDPWLIAACLLLPGARLVGVLRRPRQRANKLCLACSYDLTGNVSGVCPECGTAIGEPTSDQRGTTA